MEAQLNNRLAIPVANDANEALLCQNWQRINKEEDIFNKETFTLLEFSVEMTS